MALTSFFDPFYTSKVEEQQEIALNKQYLQLRQQETTAGLKRKDEYIRAGVLLGILAIVAYTVVNVSK